MTTDKRLKIFLGFQDKIREFFSQKYERELSHKLAQISLIKEIRRDWHTVPIKSITE